jgi:hypothetical protein
MLPIALAAKWATMYLVKRYGASMASCIRQRVSKKKAADS